MPQIQQVDKKAIKSKAFAMDIIMKDSKLSKLMADAWNAPAGSTKNTKAGSILKSLHRTRQSYGYVMDGQGGPRQPTMTQNPLDAYIQSITKQSKPAPNPTTLSSGATVPVSQVDMTSAQPTPTPVPTYAPTITGAPNPTIPNITAEQVRSAFASFGYEPDLNHMNDTGYWMTKPATEVTKLIHELRKRREKENTILEERNQKNETESRLTPERVKQLYDAYGLNDEIKNNADINRIQHVLPNDENALVKVLEAEQKRKLAGYKEKLSPMVKKQDGKGGAPTTPTQSLSELLKSVQPTTPTFNPFSNPNLFQPQPSTPNMAGITVSGNPTRTLPAVSSPVTSSVNGLPMSQGMPLGLTQPLSNSNVATSSSSILDKLKPQTNPVGWQDTPPPGYVLSRTQYGSNTPQPGNKFIYNINTGERKEVPLVSKTESTTPLTLQNIKFPGTETATSNALIAQPTIITNKTSQESDSSSRFKQFPDNTYTWVNNDGSVHIGPLGDNYVDKTVVARAPIAPSVQSSALEGPKPYDAYDNITKAIESGMGPTAFGLSLLNDKKKLAQFLSMPEVQVNTFWPENSSLLNSQLGGLLNAAKKANGLDAASQAVQDAKNRNANIDTTLANYVKGKDEYLGDIDKLLDQGKQLMASTDTSDPNTRQQMNNYMNYLTILYGGQNKRYIDMLNDGIKDDNLKYQQAIDNYNNLAKKVESDYAISSGKTTEFYNNTMAMIKEMYDNVSGRADMVQKSEDREIEKAKAADESIKRQLEIIKLQQDVNEKSTTYDKNVPATALDLMGIKLDKVGNIAWNNYDIGSAISTVSQSNNYDPAMLADQYTQNAGTYLYQKSITGNFMNEINAFEPSLQQMAGYSQAVEGDTPEITAIKQNTAQIHDTMVTTMASNVYKGIKELLISKKDRIKQAIDKLNGVGFGGGYKDKSKFIADFSDLGDIAGLLFDENYAQGQISSSIIDQDIDALAQDLAKRAIMNS